MRPVGSESVQLHPTEDVSEMLSHLFPYPLSVPTLLTCHLVRAGEEGGRDFFRQRGSLP